MRATFALSALVGAVTLAGPLAVPLSAQNNGLPGRQGSAVLMELIAERGEACELLRPWQAASIRMQTRELIASLDEEQQAAVAEEIEARRPDMGCEDALLVQWTAVAGPNMEQEALPELLTMYRALATLDPPVEAFAEATGREDYAAALSLIDEKLAALEADGVVPAGGSWEALAERQAGFADQIAAAIAGTGEDGRFSSEEAVQAARDVARITELWLADQS